MRPESSESTWLYEAIAWFELNRKRIIAGAGVLFAIVVMGYIYDWHQKRTQHLAEHELFALNDQTSTQDKSRGPSAADLLRVVEAHPGTSAAQRALLLAAATLFDEQKYQEAQTRFEVFLSKYGSHPLAPIAALGIASCLDAMNKIEEAMSAYQRVINQFPTEPAAARARLHLAVLHEHKNQPEQALKLYDELNKPNVYGSIASEAGQRRERLLQKHPALAAAKPAQSQESSPSSPQSQQTTNAPSKPTAATTPQNIPNPSQISTNLTPTPGSNQPTTQPR